ncbi:hypothetical protein [Arcanobacterium pinnipediorum]|uniref:GATA-type domain-containing protein n=1 Tax=Arcanobacterium pinnipediorum TaxID=1503041 RepID=A0ABY5AF33_9ACTO|nr:hypothetical protein [Arcanobacterium pinnipediorum]USR78814.1 hypothetical protein NG665_05310 [Arcanobacterium pinnipediorum]
MCLERDIDFGRARRMRCGRCGHEELVSHDWVESWEQGKEFCPGCGIDCTEEDRARPTYEPDDPSIVDESVSQMFWYHTSTIPDWPQKDFDPREKLTPKTVQRMTRMCGIGAVDRWVEQQKSKALHLGTYEAAIENMLRRMGDQPEGDVPFYLYRVVLDDAACIEPGIHCEPTNLVGDALPKEFLSPGHSVYRYVNEHEDEGSISLALTADAITSVSSIRIPVAANVPARQRERLFTWQDVQMKVEKAGVPDRVRHRLAGAFRAVSASNTYPLNLDLLDGLVDLIQYPSHVLALLDSVKPRLI